jgi:malonyl CoA-acyl carrier protein transacylase
MEEAAPQMVAQNVSFADVWRNEVIGGQPHYGVGKHVYTFSAHNQESLRQQASLIAQYVRERPLTLYPGLLASLAYTLGQRRSTFQWKFAVAAVTQEELIENLKTAALVPSKSSEPPRIGFLFTGQGSQWATMGKKLFDAYPIYEQTIRKAADILAGLGAEWSLIEELVKPRELSLIDKPHVSQPACTALQIALVDLLWSWSITPKSVCGHSSGEIAAAYAANILDFQSCMKVAYYRGTAANLMAEMTDENPGRMLVLAIGQQNAQALIDTNVGGRVRVACVNSPHSTTVSGDASGIAALQDTATEKSIWNRMLKVDVAYHSHHMEIVADKYSSLVGLVEPKVQTTTEFHSSLRGTQIDPSSATASYWVDNLTSPVLFSQAVESLCNARGSDGSRAVDILLEVGPHSALQGPIRQTLQSFEGSHRNIQVLPTLIRNEDEVLSMLRLSARIFTAGYRLDLRKVNFPDADSTAPKILTDLPRYQWNHNKKYWYDTRIKQEKIKFSAPRNDLLGSLIPECGLLEPQWKNELLVDDIPWLRDHKVQNVTVFPMAGYICMALEACKQQAKWRNIPYDRIIFREVSVLLSLAIPESTSIELRLSLTPFDEGPRSPSDLWSKFKVSSWSSDRGWQEHCRGLVASQLPQGANAVKGGGDLDSGLQNEIANLSRQAARCNDDVNIDWLYGMCAYSGFEFGPIFQNITQAKSSIALGVYEGTAPHTVGCMPYNCESDYTIHPVTLDLVFQGPSLFLTKDDQAARGPYVPIGIGELGILTDVPRPAGASLRMYTRMKEQDRISWRSVFDCLAVDLQKDPSRCGIWVKNFVEIPLQQDSQNAQIEGKGRCLRTQWEPCVSHLDQSQCRRMLNLNPPRPSIIEQLHILDQLGLHYMEQALKKTVVESAKSPISKKLLGWMQKLVRETPKQNSMVAEGLDMILRTVKGGLVDNVSILSPAAALICRVGENLPSIVQGEVDASSLVTQDGILDKYYQEWDSPKRLHLLVAKYIAKSAHQNPHIRILQIGADTATLAFTVLNALESAVGAAARFARYEITSSGLELSDVAKAKLRPWERQVSFRKLDIQQAPATQGLDPESYDLALISSPSHVVLHSTKAVTHIRSLLRLGGRAIFIGDLQGEERPRSLPFAVLSTWWGEEMVYDQIHQTGKLTLDYPLDVSITDPDTSCRCCRSERP